MAIFASCSEENMYIWERLEWPEFRWEDSRLLEPLAAARLKQGRLLGSMARLGFDLKLESQLESLTEEVTKSSEIEGERLDRASVRSSIARRLGVPDAAVAPADRRTEGVVEMMLDATENYEAPLTAERLLGWQAALFPTGYSGLHRVGTGAWRDDAHGPMQVVSGPVGHQRVHYQAPPAARLEAEMARFLDWFNRQSGPEGLLRAGLAHLWFVTVHPFEDGNGRIARAIADQALAQSEGSGQRFYSMSSQIRKERSIYYDMLERTQKGGLDVTDWLVWFLGCLARAIDGAEAASDQVLRKADFWQRYARAPLSARQKTVLNRYLDGFEGKLTTKKWAAIGKCSVPTAQRDINDLLDREILRRNPGGSKNTSYDLLATADATPDPDPRRPLALAGAPAKAKRGTAI
jgi:Fic family protein